MFFSAAGISRHQHVLCRFLTSRADSLNKNPVKEETPLWFLGDLP